jgi:hypothetical protein
LRNCRKTARTVCTITAEDPTGHLPDAGHKHYYLSKQFSFNWLTHEEKKGIVKYMHKSRKIILPCNSPFGSPSLWYTMQCGASGTTRQNVNFTDTGHKTSTSYMTHNLPSAIHKYVFSQFRYSLVSWNMKV